jgi:hypothetical protein
MKKNQPLKFFPPKILYYFHLLLLPNKKKLEKENVHKNHTETHLRTYEQNSKISTRISENYSNQ